jgi:cyclic pyranopterin phosphate synthase
MTHVRDTLARPVRDLRISVTDRCNFRCTYCMPREVFGPGHEFLPRAELLRFEEIETVAKAAVSLGVTKLRVTGGEPLLRRDLDQLIKRLAAIPGVEDLALTTNAAALEERAVDLRAAGLHRVTVSLDALDEQAFRRINDANFPVARVLTGIDAALAAGLGPIKVNVVVQRDVNEDEILPLVEKFRGTGVILRFIEFMDVGQTNGWRLDRVVPSAEVRARIHARYPLVALEARHTGEVARRYRFEDGAGEVGFISSVTQPFCGDCTRLRLSADGHLFTCLFASKGRDLRPWLREDGLEADALAQHMGALWAQRTDRYSEVRSAQTSPGDDRVEMSFIGG